MSMPLPSELELFPNFKNNMRGEMVGFDGSNEDLFAPIPIGRRSGTGSPASLGDATPTTYGSDGTSNYTAEDASKSFPLVLHTIISEDDSGCIHWLPCGTRFVIADKDEFSRNILPQYFGGRVGATTKFTSFTRRLKRWKFSRVPSGREMGAYYHEKFRRGDTELAKTITYPVSKSSPASSRGKGGLGGKPAVVSKARRRASTGSIMPNEKASVATGSLKSEAEPLDSISPTPIKVSLDDVDIPLPVLENDLKNWLTSTDFMQDGGLSVNNSTLSIDAEPPSVVSNSSFLLPPPAFSNNVVSGGSGLMNPISMRLGVTRMGVMRRHSTASYLPVMAASNNASNSFNSSQMLGTNFSCNPEVAMSATNNMSFAPNDNANTASTMVKQNELIGSSLQQLHQPQQIGSSPPQPQQIGSSGEDNLKDPFNMASEFSFGDMKVIDPFT